MSEPKNNADKWAPWWAYVVPIIGLNLIKQWLMQGLPDVLNIAVTVVLVGVMIVGITALYRTIFAPKRAAR